MLVRVPLPTNCESVGPLLCAAARFFRVFGGYVLRSANAGNVFRHLSPGTNTHNTVGRRVASVCCRRAPPSAMAIQTAHLKKRWADSNLAFCRSRVQTPADREPTWFLSRFCRSLMTKFGKQLNLCHGSLLPHPRLVISPRTIWRCMLSYLELRSNCTLWHNYYS